MSSLLGVLCMSLLVGTCDAYWGHTYIAEGGGYVYALRSLADGSSLCVYDASRSEKRELMTLDMLGEPLAEVATAGQHSCHITLLGREAAVADYTSGTLSLFPLSAEGLPSTPRMVYFEGSGPHPKRQQSPHVHSTTLSPDGSTLVVVDLGTDRLYLFSVAEGRVASLSDYRTVALPAGCGPRHCAFDSHGRYLYVVTELSDEVLVYDTADYSLVQRCNLGAGNPQGGSHILLSQDGRYLYASLRVSSTAGAATCGVKDGVAVFRVRDGRLQPHGYLETEGHPRHFALTADGRYLIVACRDSNSLIGYPLSLDGKLPATHEWRVELPKPVWVGEMK